MIPAAMPRAGAKFATAAITHGAFVGTGLQ